MEKMSKEEMIQTILDLELQMFFNVPTAEPTRCQQAPEGFNLTRGAAFEVWSEETLFLYLGDLLSAAANGRNLLTEKYARMDNLIPPLNLNPIIDEIVKIEVAWQKELEQKYPHAVGQGNTENCGDSAGILSFANYLRCELETYSNETLASYHRDLLKALEEGRNLAEEKYTRIFQQLGYPSLSDAELVLSKQNMN